MMKSMITSSVALAVGANALQDATPNSVAGCYVAADNQTDFYQEDGSGNWWDCKVTDIIASQKKAGGLFGCAKMDNQPEGDLKATCRYQKTDPRRFVTAQGGKLWDCKTEAIGVALNEDLSALDENKVIGAFSCEATHELAEGSVGAYQRFINYRMGGRTESLFQQPDAGNSSTDPSTLWRMGAWNRVSGTDPLADLLAGTTSSSGGALPVEGSAGIATRLFYDDWHNIDNADQAINHSSVHAGTYGKEGGWLGGNQNLSTNEWEVLNPMALVHEWGVDGN